MDFYTPLFAKIVDSSLWDEPDFVIKIFISMLVKKDRDNVVRANAYTIARWSRKNEEEVLKALELLSSPDKRRLEPQPFEGRRIERVEDGWLLLNGEFYQKLMGIVNRRAQKAVCEKNRRERLKNKTSPPGREKRFVKAHGDGDDAKADAIAGEGL